MYFTSALSATAVMDSGFTVTVNAYGSTDRMSSYTITVPASYKTHTQGLMGSYDGSAANDLTDASGYDWRQFNPSNVDAAASACMQTFAVQSSDSFFVFSQKVNISCQNSSTTATGTAASSNSSTVLCSIPAPSLSTNAILQPQVNSSTSTNSTPAGVLTVPAVWANVSLQAAAQSACGAAVGQFNSSSPAVMSANSWSSSSLYSGCLLDVYVTNSTAQVAPTTQLVQSVAVLNLPAPVLALSSSSTSSSLTPRASSSASALVQMDLSGLLSVCTHFVVLATPSQAQLLLIGNSSVCVPVLQMQLQGSSVWSDLAMQGVLGNSSVFAGQATLTFAAFAAIAASNASIALSSPSSLNVTVRGGATYFTATTQLQSALQTLGPLTLTLPSYPVLSSSLCILTYSLPGTVDYPWSSALQLNFFYDSNPLITTAGIAVALLNGTGLRSFTNRFGVTSSSSFTLALQGSLQSQQLLYLTGVAPVDAQGLTLKLSSPVQLPGSSPSSLTSLLQVYAVGGVVQQGSSALADGSGQVFLSTVPYFSNVTIAASNLNALAVSYSTCQALISFTNGLRSPTQPSSSNGGLHVSYSYTLSDGLTYSVQANLSITTASAFATLQDLLGNPYQQVIAVTGSRRYTHWATNATLVSTVTGMSPALSPPYPSQRFYPYALQSSAPGVYPSSRTAPFLDATGIGFILSPPAPRNGLPPGTGQLYNATAIALVPVGTPATQTVLSESYYTVLPVLAMQQQLYAFSN